jgi:hypothetical protein
VLIYFLAVAFQGFWLAGAFFFSDGRDSLINTSIFAWWCVFAALFVLWRWPVIAILASLFNFVMGSMDTWRTITGWRGLAGFYPVRAFIFMLGPDLIIVAAAFLALRRPKVSQ